MRARTWVLVILAVVLCCGVASPAGKNLSFKGRIAAYRPADRMQVVSFVANKELLLFQRDGADHELLKIVYVHQGFSDLKGDILSGAQDISISVRRDPSCDQALGAFEEEAPAVPLEGSTASTERVVFAASVSRPPESYRMKCYALQHWTPLKDRRVAHP
jgi:hypothetical protein